MNLQVVVCFYLTTLICLTCVDGINDKISPNESVLNEKINPHLDVIDGKASTYIQSRSSKELQYSLPYVREMYFPMYSGKEIVIEGVIQGNATNFTTLLCQTISCDSILPLSLHIDFKDKKMIRSSYYYAGVMKMKEDYGILALEPGNPFILQIKITDSMFQILVDGDIFVTSPNKMPIFYVKYVYVSGQIALNWILFSLYKAASRVNIERHQGGEKIVVDGYPTADNSEYKNIDK
ncbi:uncharacterized protein LOC131937287 [Physella acuta]|uniref:uncharacterized protein LOC131937287 n=1 Tax=Physella acuta TaxID=109671 RepID=UPI0027DC162F|nr:uncharacterized protein LOC131937287 [Physella acuta]